MKINTGVLGGNLVRDPELRYTPSGTAICDFTIANSKKYKQGDDWVEKPGFYNCIAWGKRGEVINEHFEKGKPILITYQLDFQQWDGEDGKKKTAIKLNVQDFDFVGFKNDSATGASTTNKPDQQSKPTDINDEEIPF